MNTITTIEFPQPDRIRLGSPITPDDLGGGVPIVVIAFADGAAFLEAYGAARGCSGVLAVETKAEPVPGTRLIAEVTWPALPNRVFVRCVAGRRTWRGRLPLRIEADEAGKRDFLIDAAHGEAGAIHARRHRRYCVRMPVQWRRFGASLTAMSTGLAEDLSSGGMLISTDEDAELQLHDRVVVRVDSPTGEVVVTGRVRHLHRRRMEGGLLLGVKFEQRSSGEQRTLRCLLRSCAARGIVLVDLRDPA